MACGKGNANQPIEDFIVHSPAPVDVAAKMSAIYNELSFKVKKGDLGYTLLESKDVEYIIRMKLFLCHSFFRAIFIFILSFKLNKVVFLFVTITISKKEIFIY